MNYLKSLKEKIDEINLNLKEKINLDEVEKAYFFAKKAHEGQFRASGEDYIAHPVEVAKIVLDLKPGTETVISAILHDVVEDTSYSIDDIKENFGDEVAVIVEGLTKVSNIDLSGDKNDAKIKSLRKMFIAMAKDLRVVFIKLSDRFHNLKTIGVLPEKKQKRIAQETMDIYVPVAERLGIYKMKTPLEDLCFEILSKKQFENIGRQIGEMGDDFMKNSEDRISHIIKGENFKNFSISGRVKGNYSIFKKLNMKNVQNITEIYDIFAIRVIVDSVEDCYRILGIMHKYYRPLTHRFKDYISTPKPNGYRSLHTVVIGLGQEFDNEIRPVEIQIRTKEMHFEAEYGAASHWSYKEGLKRDEQGRFIKNLIDLENEIEDNDEFLKSVHSDALHARIFVLTPRGDIKDLPKGATALDFAFAVHTEVGLKCVGANINGRGVALKTILNNGDTIKINTSQSAKPNPMWLNFVKTSRAISEIKKWLNEQNKDLLLEDGIKLLNECLIKLGQNKLDKNYSILKEFDGKKMTKNEREELLEKIGKGAIPTIFVIKKILGSEKLFSKVEKKIDEKEKNKKGERGKGVYFKGGGDNYKLMKTCCDPQEGDEIIGYVGRGSYIGVHKKSCPFVKSADYKRFIKGYWEGGPAEYTADLDIEFLYLANDSGKVFKIFDIDGVWISKIFYEEDLNPNFQVLKIGVYFTNLNNFSLLVEKIQELDFVQNIFVKNLKS
ncbi:RelA/SpoT family protein [Candidatus Gracilibacteria bacterium]|nr:RelA/SpoT family protein [Candidatus Gracilibacteria bacterium]